MVHPKLPKLYGLASSLLLLGAVAFFLSGPAGAEIERFAQPSDHGLRLYWWPKVAPPEGCHHDDEESVHYAFNAFAPDRQTFVNADTVFYAKAAYKPRMPEVKSLGQFMINDRGDFLQNAPSVNTEEAAQLRTEAGLVFQSVTFFPQKEGNWERVSYADEGDFYLTFVISARSRKAYEAWEKTYVAWVRSYR